MYFVYVLKSAKDGNLYIGCTSDVETLFRQHLEGKVFSTKSRRPLALVYKEGYSDKYEAFKMERFYKTPAGKKELRKKI